MDRTKALETPETKLRTNLQNRSLHKYGTLLADALNDAGIDQRAVFKEFREDFKVPWTMESVKHIFREIGRAMYGVESTSKLTTVQMQEVYRVFDKRMSEITGVHIEWPSLDAQQYSKK